MSWLRANTLCRLDRHCRREKGIKKYDGGRCPVLCRHCRRFIGTWQ